MRLYPIAKRTCGYFVGNDYRLKSSPIKYLKIGDINLQIQNLNNKKIRIQKISFEIRPDGNILCQSSGYDTVNTLEELKETVKRYRLAHQEMKALEKKLKMQGDFT